MNQALFAQLRGVGIGAILSVGLHGALALAVLQAPQAWLTDTSRNEPVFLELVDDAPVALIEPDTPEVAPEPTPLQPTPVEPETQLPPEALDPDVQALPPESTDTPPGALVPAVGTPTGDGMPNGSGVASSVEAPSTAGASSGAIDPRSDQMRLLLDPSRVARSGYQVTGPGPSRPSGPAGLGTGPRGPTEQELEAMHSGSLRRQAMAKAHITREPVVLRREPDGSRSWAGPMFTARVAPNGEVTFEDGADVNTNGFSASGNFDLQGAIMGAQGQDPRAAERERFMRETRAEREAMEDEYRREVQQRQVRRIRGELRSVWARADRSAERRRRRIFFLWDRITDDGSMDDVKAAVLTFVRINLPQGSADAFTTQELAAMNARRRSRREFAPY
ncbi:MAG: hypothetical protein AB8I08_07780 [Sandaracinaceae bacterium]